MTLPALQSSINKMDYVIGVKKAYETLNQIIYRLKAENGDISQSFSGLTAFTTSGHEGMANIFIHYMNVAKTCGTSITPCFSASYKYLGGSTYGSIPVSEYGCFLTNDNMSYAFHLISTDCTYHDAGVSSSSPLYNECARILVDINGPNKGPSTIGRDLFRFFLTKNGLYPGGACNETWFVDDDCSTYGQGCASKVLLEGAMNY